MILGFRSKISVIFIEYLWKLSDSLLSLEIVQSVSEIITLLGKFHLTEEHGLDFCKKFLLSMQVLSLPLKNNLFYSFLIISCKCSFALSSDLFFFKYFISLELIMMTFLNIFLIKGLLLSLKILFLTGAWILSRFWKALWNWLNLFNSSQSLFSLTEQKVKSNWWESSELK